MKKEQKVIVEDLMGFDKYGDFVFDEGKNRTPKYHILNMHTPQEMVDYLNKKVVGQDHAKKRVALEVYKQVLRYNNRYNEYIDKETLRKTKNGIFFTGLSGVGKTYIWECLAEFTGLPIVITDSTAYTQAGYVGKDLENVFKDLLANANYDRELAEYGIVVFDEFDKLGRKGASLSTTAEPTREAVQQRMLKMLEGDIVSLPNQDRLNPAEKNKQFDTKNILFGAVGAFENIEDLVKERLGKDKKTTGIGFGASIVSKSEQPSMKELRKNIIKEDLVKFGIMPEILGRFTILENLMPLDKDDLIKILKLDSGLSEQHKLFFKIIGKELTIDDSLYEYIVNKSLDDRTGARNLKSTFEELMFDISYKATIDNRKKKYVIDKEYVESLQETIA